MGGINFGCLIVSLLSPDRLIRELEIFNFYQALRWSRRACRWRVRAVPRLCIVYPVICLTTDEKSRKNLSQVTKMHSLNQRRTRFLWPKRTIVSTGMLAPAELGFRDSRQCQPSVNVIICRFAVIGVYPCQQLTLSQSSQSGLWCGRQKAEYPDPRESANYVQTYHGAPVGRRRHLDFKPCSLWT